MKCASIIDTVPAVTREDDECVINSDKTSFAVEQEYLAHCFPVSLVLHVVLRRNYQSSLVLFFSGHGIRRSSPLPAEELRILSTKVDQLQAVKRPSINQVYGI